MTSSTVSFGKWLKTARKEMGFTQKELADLAGCSPISVRKIEAEAYRPSRQIAERLVESLEVPGAERESLIRLARAEKQPSTRLSVSEAGPGQGNGIDRIGNLPAQTTRILGREAERHLGRTLLLRDDLRLLTLTGAPGIGKTRLALYICESLVDYFRDGIFFVSLAPINDPALVAATIARNLDVQEIAEETSYSTLVKYLRDKQLLLLLDNFEHVAAASHIVADLLSECALVKILVTSREVLHLRGEHQVPVPPLAAPDVHHIPPLGELQEYAAVRLFVERSVAANPSFVLTEQNAVSIGEICAHLDGLPLAIEIASARTKLFSPQEIKARLTDRLGLLTSSARDVPDRQQTLRKAIDWSYNLLDEAEQTLFARMGVFVGGCTLAAVSAICDPVGDLGVEVTDGAQSLLDKSLVQQGSPDEGERRLRMLETLREYALEMLEKSGDTERVRRWHAHYYSALAETAEPELTLQNQLQWIDRLEQEHDNMRAALEWLLRPESDGAVSKDVQLGLRLSGALWRFWLVRGHFTEGRKWLEMALDGSEAHREGKGSDSWGAVSSSRAKALHGLGGLAFTQGDLPRAQCAFSEALALRREVGDIQGAAGTLSNMGLVAASLGEYASARLYYEECLVALREIGDKVPIARALNNFGMLMHDQGDLEAARTLHEESLHLVNEMGNKAGIGASMTNLGLVYLDLGDFRKARELLEGSLDIAQELGSRYDVAGAYINLSVVAYLQGDHLSEVELLRNALTLQQELGNKIGTANCIEGLGAAIGVLGHPVEGTRLIAAGATLRQALSAPLPPKDRARYERSVAAVRELLGEEAFGQAWEEGSLLDPDDAAHRALTCHIAAK